jgi:hypothetical protein
LFRPVKNNVHGHTIRHSHQAVFTNRLC